MAFQTDLIEYFAFVLLLCAHTGIIKEIKIRKGVVYYGNKISKFVCTN